MADSQEAAWKAIGETFREHEAATEEMLEDQAWHRHFLLFRLVPVDIWRPSGMGQG